MPAGSWDLEVTTGEGKRHSGEITLAAGAQVPMPLDADAFEEAVSTTDTGLAASASEPSAIAPLLPWAGVAAGVATTGVGVALLLAASSKQQDLDADLNQGDGNVWTIDDKPISFSLITYAEAQTRQDAINADSRNAGIVTAVGSALLVGSTVWAVMNLMDGGAEAPEATESTARFFLAPNGVGITGRF